MRSERARRRGNRLAWLRSQGLGVICGLSTVALLAVGSFALAATGEGASAGVSMDDLRAFFERPSLVHAWFYALVAVMTLYAVNTAYATLHGVVFRWRAGVRAPAKYAAAVIHVGFLVALLAHGVGGLFGEERGQVLLSRGWTPLPGDREARLRSLEVERLPNGMPKEVRAAVEVRGPDGRVEDRVIGYNAPLSSGLGSDLHLLAQQGELPAAHLVVGDASCTVSEVTPCAASGRRVALLAAVPAGRMGMTATARVRVAAPGGNSEAHWLVAGRGAQLADGTPLRLEGVGGEPAVLLRSRRAPGNPWALLSAILVAVGLLMMWRRFLPARRKHGDAAVSGAGITSGGAPAGAAASASRDLPAAAADPGHAA